MKKLFKFTLSTLAISLSALSFNAYSATIIKVHSDTTEDSAQQEGLERFKELVESRSNGEYSVTIYPNNALGNDVEVAQQMQFGAVQAAPIPTAKLSGFNKDLQLIDMPFLFPNRDVAYKFMDGEIGKEVLAGLRKSGFEAPMFWESGFKQLTCNTSVEKPQDLQGKKVRVMESPLLISQYKALGSNPVPIAFSETYTALQQGVVECQENGQSAENQTLLTEAVLEAGKYQRERSIAREDVYLTAIKEAGGTEVIELNQTQLNEFRNAMSSVYEEFSSKLSEGLLQRSQSELKKLSSL